MWKKYSSRAHGKRYVIRKVQATTACCFPDPKATSFGSISNRTVSKSMGPNQLRYPSIALAALYKKCPYKHYFRKIEPLAGFLIFLIDMRVKINLEP